MRRWSRWGGVQLAPLADSCIPGRQTRSITAPWEPPGGGCSSPRNHACPEPLSGVHSPQPPPAFLSPCLPRRCTQGSAGLDPPHPPAPILSSCRTRRCTLGSSRPGPTTASALGCWLVSRSCRRGPLPHCASGSQVGGWGLTDGRSEWSEWVLAKIMELQAAASAPPRVWVTGACVCGVGGMGEGTLWMWECSQLDTAAGAWSPSTRVLPPCSHAGHSLGGALATLASLEIARAHPQSRVTTYTLGCPRVGGCLRSCLGATGVVVGGRAECGNGLARKRGHGTRQSPFRQVPVLSPATPPTGPPRWRCQPPPPHLHTCPVCPPTLTLPASLQVGNRAFAAEYNAAVPDTWCLINAEVGAQGGWVGAHGSWVHRGA